MFYLKNVTKAIFSEHSFSHYFENVSHYLEKPSHYFVMVIILI